MTTGTDRIQAIFQDARDLARFDAMLSNGGELDGARILKPETVAEVTALEIEGLVIADPRTDIGSDADDSEGYSPSGDYSSYGGKVTSGSWADPCLGLAVAYITNGARSEDPNAPA